VVDKKATLKLKSNAWLIEHLNMANNKLVESVNIWFIDLTKHNARSRNRFCSATCNGTDVG
jgi:hypothetical protein